METPEQLFNAALAKVESKSIRAWAVTDHNRPLWLRIAADCLSRGKDADFLCLQIVATAIGLW